MSDANRCQMKEMDENTPKSIRNKKYHKEEFVYILNG